MQFGPRHERALSRNGRIPAGTRLAGYRPVPVPVPGPGAECVRYIITNLYMLSHLPSRLAVALLAARPLSERPVPPIFLLSDGVAPPPPPAAQAAISLADVLQSELPRLSKGMAEKAAAAEPSASASALAAAIAQLETAGVARAEVAAIVGRRPKSGRNSSS